MRLIVACLFLFLSFTGFTQNNNHIHNVDALTFKKMVDKKDGILIDLRTKDEVAKGIIPGARVIDFLSADWDKEFAKLDKKKTYYVYCAGGGRSSEAAEQMANAGFVNIVNLTKGFADWKKAGLPVSKVK